MPDFDNSMRGVLFPNDKEGNEKRPDLKGNGEVNGTEVWISAWFQVSKAGKKYISLQFENKEGQTVAKATASAPAADVPIDNDFGGFDTGATGADEDIPF